MKVTIIGQLSQIGNEEVFGEKGFRKKEVIVKTVEEYPQFYVVEFAQLNIDLLDGFAEGDNVNITAGLNGREYTNPDTGKYSVFMSLRGWRIEKV